MKHAIAILALLFPLVLGLRAEKIHVNGESFEAEVIELSGRAVIRKGEAVDYAISPDAEIVKAFRALVADLLPQCLSYDDWVPLVDAAQYTQPITKDFFEKIQQARIRIQSERTLFNFCIRVDFKGRAFHMFPILLVDSHGETRTTSVIERKENGYHPSDIFEFPWMVPLGTAKPEVLRSISKHGAVFDADKKQFLTPPPARAGAQTKTTE